MTNTPSSLFLTSLFSFIISHEEEPAQCQSSAALHEATCSNVSTLCDSNIQHRVCMRAFENPTFYFTHL